MVAAAGRECRQETPNSSNQEVQANLREERAAVLCGSLFEYSEELN